MAVFTYQARTKEGELQIGTVEASSSDSAIGILQRNNLIVVEVHAEAEIPLYLRKVEIFRRVSKREVVAFSRQLATLFEADVPIIQSLKTLGDQTFNPYFKGKIFEIMNEVDGGAPLSRAFESHSDVFSSFYVSMVRSGELSGRLQETLTYLADHIERDYQITSQIRNSLTYPAFVLFGFIVVGVLMMSFVIPQLTAVLEESGQELPLVTRIIIGISNFTRIALVPGFVLFAFLLFLSWQYNKTDEGKRFFDKIVLNVPLLGSILRNIYISRFAENLGTLITGGLPIAQALNVSAATIGNTIYRDTILKAEQAVRRGEAISETLKTAPKEFPPIVTQMVATGEQTGKLDFILKNLAIFYQREVRMVVDNLLGFIEPVLIVVLGLAVGVLVAAILVPIYNLVGAF